MHDETDILDPKVIELSRFEDRRGHLSPGDIAGDDLVGDRTGRRDGAGEKPAAGAGAEPEPPPEGRGEDEAALALDKLSLFPSVGDPYDRAYATPARGSLPMLLLLCKDGARPTFAYGDLRFIDVRQPRHPGDSPGLLLKFLGVGTVELDGLNLDRLHGYLYLHRLGWIRELPPGRKVPGDGDVVVTAIRVTMPASRGG